MSYKLLGSVLSPFVRKVRVLMLEKGVEFELDQIIPFLAPESFTKISPLRRVPVLQDSKRGSDWALPDSSAICQYLERENPDQPLYPQESASYARALWLEEYADTEFSNTIGQKIFRPLVVEPLLGSDPDIKLAKEAFNELLPSYFNYFEEQLGSNEFFVDGALTIADISIAVHFQNLRLAGLEIDARQFPSLADFVSRLLGRESFQECNRQENEFLEESGFQVQTGQ